MVYQTCILFEVPISWKLVGFVFSGSVSSYNFHWYLTPPAVENPGRKIAWNISNRNLHLFFAVTGLLVAGIFGWLLISHWPWLAITGLATFLYSAPKIDHPFFIRLRKIAIAKTIYLALIWTMITSFLPIIIQVNQLSSPEVIFFINRFFFIYAICILFDYRDVEWDRKSGIRSLITYFDEKGINRLFWSSMLVVAVTLILLLESLHWTYILALLTPCIILGLLYSRAKSNFSDYLYYFVLDGLMMLSAPLVVLAKFAR
jgi:4-hydroxybenzoate polyprenyltransferase